jgi:hypothetical protein
VFHWCEDILRRESEPALPSGRQGRSFTDCGIYNGAIQLEE